MVDKEQVVGDVVVVIGLNKDLGIGAIKLPAEWVDREDGGEGYLAAGFPFRSCLRGSCDCGGAD